LQVISEQKFLLKWDGPGTDTPCSSEQMQQLKDEGFKSYAPRGDTWVYQVTRDDMDRVSSKHFLTSSGARQLLQPGDFLAVDVDQQEINSLPAEVVKDRYSEKRDRTQAELFDEFEERIKKGQLMFKKVWTAIRPGRHGESRDTCVFGQWTGNTRITDNTSFVVFTPPPTSYIYVLPLEKKEAMWERVGELHPNCGFANWDKLRRDGFKQYKPRLNFKWVYKLTAEDVAWFPTRRFQASWDVTVAQPVHEGDYLAMHYNEGLGKEVWLVHSTVVEAEYGFVNLDTNSSPVVRQDEDGSERERFRAWKMESSVLFFSSVSAIAFLVCSILLCLYVPAFRRFVLGLLVRLLED